MKIAVVVLSHDGLQSVLTGVGVVVNSFVESFAEIKRDVKFFSKNETSLICLAPYIKKNSKDFHKYINQKTEQVCRKNNGYLKEFRTLYGGLSQQKIWGDIKQWEYSSKIAAELIEKIKADYDKIIVLAHDTIFALTAKYLKEDKNLKLIWIPHSLGKLFFEKKIDRKRINLENKSIKVINESKYKFVGYIGNSFKKSLLTHYGVKKNKLMPLINGIYNKSSRFANGDKNRNLIKLIPNNKKLIFSWGRAVYQKGYDIIIPAYSNFLKENKNYHLLLLMPSETSDEKYLREIRNELKKLPKSSYTAIFKFDSHLPIQILRHKNLNMVIFCSRYEGNPITPLEILAFSNNKVKILYSNIPPLMDIFSKVSTSQKFKIDIKNLQKKMRKIIITKSSRKKVKIDIVDNYTEGLNKLLS